MALTWEHAHNKAPEHTAPHSTGPEVPTHWDQDQDRHTAVYRAPPGQNPKARRRPKAKSRNSRSNVRVEGVVCDAGHDRWILGNFPCCAPENRRELALQRRWCCGDGAVLLHVLDPHPWAPAPVGYSRPVCSKGPGFVCHRQD